MSSDCHEISEEMWNVGNPTDMAGDFVEIDLSEVESYPGYMSAAHAMYYSLTDTVLWNEFKVSAYILMQMRFDGNLGFPGGLIDPTDSSPVEGLNRELVEEMNVERNGGDPSSKPVQTGCHSQVSELHQTGQHSQPAKPDQPGHNFQTKIPDETGAEPTVVECYLIRQSDHIISHVNHKKKLITHFYAKQITEQEFNKMERRALGAMEWGSETLGILRVPLYSLRDNLRGLPVFLANQFAGNARDQLILTIQKKKIIAEAELKKMIDSYINRYVKQ